MTRVLFPNYSVKPDHTLQPIVQEQTPSNRSRDHILLLRTLKFESYPWEIEVTPKVFRMLKEISDIPECYVSIAKGLANMANGSPLHESKILTTGKILLYQTTIDGCQILWEKAIQCVEDQKQYYKQVIRLWDVIKSDEMELFESTAKRIVDSYNHVKCIPLSVLQSDHNDRSISLLLF